MSLNIITHTIFAMILLLVFVFICEYANNKIIYTIFILYSLYILISLSKSIATLSNSNDNVRYGSGLTHYETKINSYITIALVIIFMIYCIYRIVMMYRTQDNTYNINSSSLKGGKRR